LRREALPPMGCETSACLPCADVRAKRAATPVYCIGDCVKVRLSGDMPWRRGIVIRTDPLQVRPEGWYHAHWWRYVEPLDPDELCKLQRGIDAATNSLRQMQPCLHIPPFLPKEGLPQLSVRPNQWALTIEQSNRYIDWCRSRPEFHKMRAYESGSAHAFERLFIDPHTKDAGCSIAMLLNNGEMQAKLMIVNAWGGDVSEAQEAVNGSCLAQGITQDTPVWWSYFSMFLAGDRVGACGPTIQEQLCLEPMEHVLSSQCVRDSHVGMVVVQTSTVDLYKRLWCLYDISQALKFNLVVRAAASQNWLANPVGGLLAAFEVNSAESCCGFPDDDQMLRRRIQQVGGFRSLDAILREVRLQGLVSAFDMQARTDKSAVAAGWGLASEVGLRVKVRDSVDMPWKIGKVTGESPTKVTPEGWCSSHTWEHVKPLDDEEAHRWSAEVRRCTDNRKALVKSVEPCCERPEFLPGEGRAQLSVNPNLWALTMQQLNQFVDWSKLQPSYRRVKEINGYVCEYDLSNLFIVPLTKSSGCSISMLMNGGKFPAKLMISHAWAEDVEESLRALNKKGNALGIPLTTAVWWCPFSIYQGGGAPGGMPPTVAAQLQLEPFKTVIASAPVSELGMFVVHTSTADLYTRLWCVHEIDEALRIPIPVRAAASDEWMRDPAGGSLETFNFNTERAECGFPEDDEMIRKCIHEHGGFAALDKVIRRFRLEIFKTFTQEAD